MLSLRWYQVALLCCIASLLLAQSGKNYNYLEYKRKSYYFGISLGLNSSQHQVFHSSEFTDSKKFLRAQGIPAAGFNVNGIVNYKFGDYFDFRLLPGFTFSTRHLEFDQLVGTEVLSQRKTVESIFVNVPFHIRYKSSPYKDKRAYVLAGINYTYDVASNSKARESENLIKINPHDIQLEAGFGMQFFFPYFILSPEIKFSRGINNTLLYNNQLEESTIMEKLLSRVFTISFHFEG